MKTPKFNEFSTMDWDEIQPLYQQLQDVELTENTVKTWMEDWSDLRKLVDERYARLSLATAVNTADQDAENTYHAFLEEIYPSIRAADQKLKEKILESKLVPDGMELALEEMRAEADLFREENLPLMTEESKLSTEYNKIFGAQTVDWDGDEITLIQVKSAMFTEDRDLRKDLWEMMSQRQLEDREAVNDLWEKFMAVRMKMATNAGFEDYRSYAWQQRLRMDYTPKESKQFVDAVKGVAVPAATRIYQRYQDRLQIDQVRPWDLLNNQTTFSLPAIQAFKTEDEFVSKVGKIIDKLDPVLGDYFQTMRDKDLLDLMNRKNKRPGGFCTSFATECEPFIFMNATGKGNDLRVLFHESGHAFHVFERTGLPYHHQWRPGMEFTEVASTAMELLAESYLSKDNGGFMAPREAARARLLNLEEKVLFWPYMAVVVAFQHWVYKNHDLASKAEACDEKWGELIDIFMPEINWEGYLEVKNTGWHRKLHIHLAPFYYIEYGLASLGAFQIWENAHKDQAKALKAYRQSLRLGGTATITDLFKAAGARLSFDKKSLGAILQMIEVKMADLESQII